jgi:O-antigen ligase
MRLPLALRLHSHWEGVARLPAIGHVLMFASVAVLFPAAWISLASAIFLLLAVFSGSVIEKKERLGALFAHPVAAAALLLWGWMALSLLWSPAPFSQALQGVWAYRELFFLALMLPFMRIPAVQSWMLRAFAVGFVVVLFISYLRWFGVLPRHPVTAFSAFTGHTGFSLLLATGAFGGLLWAIECPGKQRWLGLGVAVIALFNLYFVNTGRTGQLAFLVALPLLCAQGFDKRKGVMAIGMGILAAVAVALIAHAFSPVVQKRFDGLLADLSAYVFEGKRNSYDGARLEFWENSLTLMALHPVTGGGASSFAIQYREKTHEHGWSRGTATANPHNEYLMIGTQFGLVGLLLFFGLLVAQWRQSKALTDFRKPFLRGFLLMFVTGCLFNSLLLDNMEGHLYALLSAALSSCGQPDAKGQNG